MNRLPSILLFVVALTAPTFLLAQGSTVNELKLGEASATQGSLASIPLTMTSTEQVQGIVAVFEWDGAVGSGDSLNAGAAIQTADTVVRRVEASFMVLGVVIDSDGTPPAFIEPGTNVDLATAVIRCATGAATDVSTDLTFVDNKYGATADGPLLENLVTVGGLSITKTEGLTLTKGKLTCRLPAENVVWTIQNGSPATGTDCGEVPVLMDSGLVVQGYEVAIGHPDALTLDSITAGSAATQNGADFTDVEVLPNGGVLGVVLDLIEPFNGNTIPPGQGLEIARYKYCCKTRPAAGQPPAVHALTFVDGVLSNPPKDNLVVVGGLAITPELHNGTFTCPPSAAVEDCDDGIDNDGDGLIDANDPDCQLPPQMFACGGESLGTDGLPVPPTGSVGGTVDVCFYYKSPEDNLPGHPQFDHIQGLSMAVCYPCDLRCNEGTFDITGTIVEAVNADFVSHQCDNDPNDGDGCELIIGILIDSLPPFDGTTLPPTDKFEKVGCIQFTVSNDSTVCGKCLPITFCDGANGRGKVPIKNLISAENESRKPQLMNCEVCIRGEPVFHRGDCNFSNMGNMSVDIADAAATISFLFGQESWKFNPPCLDACDCNDDGRIDLADATCVLTFLFQFGRFPPAPGPGFDMAGNDEPAGPDPTPDKLDCKGSGDC